MPCTGPDGHLILRAGRAVVAADSISHRSATIDSEPVSSIFSKGGERENRESRHSDRNPEAALDRLANFFEVEMAVHVTNMTHFFWPPARDSAP